MREMVFVLTDHGEHGIGVTSPNAPGLIAGVATMDDATPTYLLGLAREHDAAVEGFVVYVEHLVARGQAVFRVRCRQDFFLSERAHVAEALVRTLEESPTVSAEWPVGELGETILVASLPGDRVADVAQSVCAGETAWAVVRHGDSAWAWGIDGGAEHDETLTVASLGDEGAAVVGRESARQLELSG